MSRTREAGADRAGRARFRMPLRTRLAWITSATVALVLVGACAAAFLVVRYELTRQLDLQLTRQAHQIIRQGGDLAPQVVEGECDWLAAPACAQVVPADPSRDPSKPYLLPVTGETRAVAAGRSPAGWTNITLSGRPARMLTTPAGYRTALQVAVRSDGVRDATRQAGELMAAIGGVGAVLAGVLGYGAARAGLSPVAALTAVVERIAATRDARHRVELPPGNAGRRDEVTRLGAAFTTMLAELDASVTAQRRLVADASHELRTPLTALRTNAELLARADRLTPAQRDRASTALDRQVREVGQLVSDLVELARDEEPRPLVERVVPAVLAGECVAVARDHWPGVEFRLGIAADAADTTVLGVPARLVRLLGNLLDNAAKFSPPGGRVEVAVRVPSEAPDSLDVVVRDHGPGIAPADLPYVFDRFYRASAARALPGSGLGLAMARQIARAHGADLTAETPPTGGGTPDGGPAEAAGAGALFRLRLPTTASPFAAHADDSGFPEGTA
ncbi:HAMP domain-containing sensor histidine kinase [Streptantibioticus parmotrematis]|uniref:sensor histidine kinase n=1 Tax=Streptantibioticus parmotrematis TaxID=2873249 RepID=UPI0033DD491E